MLRGFPKWALSKTPQATQAKYLGVLYDYSGSMGDEKRMGQFNELLGRLCTPPSKGGAYAVKVFPYGADARTQDDFGSFRGIDRGSTNIQAGVIELNRAINAHEAPTQFVILWISDGADNCSHSIEVI